MTCGKKGWALAAILALTACGPKNVEVGDTRIITILHISTKPAGWVTAYEDSSFTFLEDHGTEERGDLSASELSALRAEVANLQFREQSESDYVACEKSADGYTFMRQGGTICRETNSSADSAEQDAVEFLAEFYREKSGAP